MLEFTSSVGSDEGKIKKTGRKAEREGQGDPTAILL